MVELLLPDEADDVLSAEGTLVLFAWAPACGACYQMGQHVSLAAEEFRRLAFYRLDVRDPAATALVRRLDLRVAPTVVLYKGGREQRRIEDSWQAGELWEMLQGAG